jgi:hypothetical protein
VVSIHYNSFHILYPSFASLSVLDVYDWESSILSGIWSFSLHL